MDIASIGFGFAACYIAVAALIYGICVSRGAVDECEAETGSRLYGHLLLSLFSFAFPFSLNTLIDYSCDGADYGDELGIGA